MEKRQLWGIAGSIILFVGVFTPIISMPIVGSMNYYNTAKGSGVLLLLFAVASLILVIKKMYKFLWVIVVTGYSLVLGKLAVLMLDSVQLQWGWAVLMAGPMLIQASAGKGAQN